MRQVECASLAVLPQVVSWEQVERRRQRIAARLDALSTRRKSAVPAARDVERHRHLEFGQKRLLARGVWMVAVLCVIGGSLVPADTIMMRMIGALHVNDKLLHFMAYTLIAFLPMLYEDWRFNVCAGLGAVALGVSLEFGQLYSPGRAFEYADMMANAVGVGYGVIAGLPVRSWIRRG